MNENDILIAAENKINKELADFNSSSRYSKAIHQYVAEKLIDFCKQNIEFAKVILATKRTLTDCCDECVKEVKNGYLSDLEVYKRAVKFYFPNSNIKMILAIETGEAPSEEYVNKEPEIKPAKNANKPAVNNSSDKVEKEKSKVKEKKDTKVKTAEKKSKKDEGQLLLFDLM